jgi:hypothetical protein
MAARKRLWPPERLLPRIPTDVLYGQLPDPHLKNGDALNKRQGRPGWQIPALLPVPGDIE